MYVVTPDVVHLVFVVGIAADSASRPGNALARSFEVGTAAEICVLCIWARSGLLLLFVAAVAPRPLVRSCAWSLA